MFASCEILPFLVKFRSHDMLDGGRAREAVPGVSKLWDINKEVNRVESAELENHIHFLDQTVSCYEHFLAALGVIPGPV